MPDKQLFTFREPVGVAAVITAGNFPVAVPVLVPGAGAAVRQRRGVEAGRVRRRPAPRRWPSCSLARRPARRRAEQWCTPTGRRPSTGWPRRWTPAWSTRSASPARPRSGARIGELCGRHLQTPVPGAGRQEPDGGQPDADLDLAVEGALFAGFGTAGQRCTSLGTVIVHESVHDEFLGRFDGRGARGRRSATRPGDVLYGPMLDRAVRRPRTRGIWAGSSRTTGCTAPPAPAGSPRTTRATASSAIPRPGCTTTR